MERQPRTNPSEAPDGALVVMGVAGCGKSSVAAALASALGWRLVEGDDFHSAESRAKMAQGIALDDEDRAGWLDRLAQQLQSGSQGTVLTCSALKRAYRERLRQAVPALRFAYLQIDREPALARVAGRESHFFSPSLVSSQFAALEDPRGEAGVLALDATAPLAQIVQNALRWIRQPREETR